MTAAEEAQATAEYALILALVFLAAVVAYQLFGQAVAGLFQQFVNAL
jgi:Flp pilus assembly pilin Flp